MRKTLKQEIEQLRTLVIQLLKEMGIVRVVMKTKYKFIEFENDKYISPTFYRCWDTTL